jgi:hypothetical protein
MTATGKPTGSNAGASADPRIKQQFRIMQQNERACDSRANDSRQPLSTHKRAGLASDPAAQWIGTQREIPTTWPKVHSGHTRRFDRPPLTSGLA